MLIERGMLESEILAHPGERVYAGSLPHVRYLKVSEGCDHGCAFCAIPLMRGKHRSFALDDIIREAQLLELQGAKEVNLVAQDLAHYGRDRRDGVGLPALLEALVAETSIPWIRMLYLYSAGITPRLLEVMARESRVLPYLDMPMQHAADRVLKAMRRPERKATIRGKIGTYRDAIPDVAIRTTVIVGFPGETEADVDELCEFLEEMSLERVGVFAYSPQEGTRAAQLADDVPDSIKRERVERVSELQRGITADRYEARIGSRVKAIVDRAAEGGEPALARLPWQADDIDGITRLDRDHAQGTFVDVEVTGVVDDYDFDARVTAAPVAPPGVTRRPLPTLRAPSTAGSYGR
jgi:ribosomal protein S12 methylthiotransferase